MGTYRLERDIPVEEGYDVAVLGGGPAGCAAAVSAARMGAKVLLVEAMGCLGGTGTSGLVTEFDPMANGEQMLVGGWMREVMETLYERGYVPDLLNPERWQKLQMRWTPFDAEGLKLLLDEMMENEKVEVRFFTKVIDADVEEGSLRVKGVVLSNVEGYRYVRAKAYIDATGDAVLSHLCGVRCWDAGTDTPNIMPPTLCALLSGVDWRETGYQDVGLPDHQAKIDQAIADGFFSQPDHHVPGLFMSMGNLGSMNAGHVFGMSSTNCASLSQGMVRGRRLVQEYLRFYQKYYDLPKLQLVTTAAMMGIRESRRIQGEYVLGYEDYTARRKFPDQIAIFAKAIDIHVYDCSEEQYDRYYGSFTKVDRYKPGEYYGIPYGVLVPKGSVNLWTAGRCVSADVMVQGSLRVQPAAAMMGQASGVAAVQHCRTGQPACGLNTEDLVRTLRAQGANLPQERLSREMTRGGASQETIL